VLVDDDDGEGVPAAGFLSTGLFRAGLDGGGRCSEYFADRLALEAEVDIGRDVTDQRTRLRVVAPRLAPTFQAAAKHDAQQLARRGRDDNQERIARGAHQLTGRRHAVV